MAGRDPLCDPRAHPEGSKKGCPLAGARAGSTLAVCGTAIGPSRGARTRRGEAAPVWWHVGIG